MAYLFAPFVTSLPIAGSALRFPLRRVWCIGRNYADHVKEMGQAALPQAPVIFGKPADAVVAEGGAIPFPCATVDLHHEVELVVAIGQDGFRIAPEAALQHVYGYAVGIDFTRRDLQQAAKARGEPWETAKSFDRSAPVGVIQPASACGHPASGAIHLSVNGKLRQQGDLAQMIWRVPALIAQVSRLFELHAGDLLFTGTPAGVGAVVAGDRLEAEIEGVGTLAVTLTAP
ncbi:MAG: fumarylacetoacetate hydrolase family protein [Rhodocyclaceae bacterium]|nr:fumarylacetoacetate hydrolase family protein [Rhodocyclaceae bacterium]MBX3670502.1 fumarylacetoacetate hydrolase family protein [Rhodocyclaceae bacterium]